MKTKGLLTSIMAPEASVKVGEMSSKSRLQINSKKQKKNSQYLLGNQTKAQKKKKREKRWITGGACRKADRIRNPNPNPIGRSAFDSEPHCCYSFDLINN